MVLSGPIVYTALNFLKTAPGHHQFNPKVRKQLQIQCTSIILQYSSLQILGSSWMKKERLEEFRSFAKISYLTGNGRNFDEILFETFMGKSFQGEHLEQGSEDSS